MGIKVSESFPSKWLKAEDIGERRKVRAVISDCQLEKLGDDEKIVVYFRGKDKGLACNKTNAMRISDAYGDDTDDWRGREIFLFVEKVPFQGRLTPAIRVELPKVEAKFEDEPEVPPAISEEEIPW